MSLLDDAIALTTHRGSTCSVGIFLDRHPDIADDLRAAMGAEVSAAAIAAALKARGLDLGAESIQRHRKERCKCR